VHEIDPTLAAGLWEQFDEDPQPVAGGLLMALPERGKPMPATAAAPRFPLFAQRSRRPDYGTDDLRTGFSVEMLVKLKSTASGQVLVENRTADGRGFALQTGGEGALEIVLNDGRTENRWSSDAGMLEAGKVHHAVVSIDGGPKIITFVIDGKLCDGGDRRQFGWGRFSANLRSAIGDQTLRIGGGPDGEIRALRVYGRSLRTSEAVRDFRAGIGASTH
jgi:hypothetical protein